MPPTPTQPNHNIFSLEIKFSCLKLYGRIINALPLSGQFILFYTILLYRLF